MGLMMQESFVFTGTVMDNLRYGNLAAGDEELIRAAELVCADGFIRALPHGYDTVLTEGGAMLSQGEKQLLALARTMRPTRRSSSWTKPPAAWIPKRNASCRRV